jgi:hypothetical protein
VSIRRQPEYSSFAATEIAATFSMRATAVRFLANAAPMPAPIVSALVSGTQS